MGEENSQNRKSARRPLTRGEQMGLVAVIAMGIILVVGFVIVVFTIATRLGALGEADAPPSATAEVFTLPEGESLLSTALDGDRMALTTRGQEGIHIHIIELPGGALVSTTRLGPVD